YLIASRARLRLAIGDAAGARAVLDPYPADPRGPVLLSIARAELLVDDGLADQAVPLLADAVEYGGGVYDELLQAMVLLALLRDQSSPGSHHAVASLVDAIELAAPEQYVQPFLQFGSPVDRLLRTVKGLGTRHPAFIDQVRAKLAEMTP